MEREDAWAELVSLQRCKKILENERLLFVHADGENIGGAIKIETWEMPMLNRTEFDSFEKISPALGDGYVALLEVYSQLDCLVSEADAAFLSKKFH